MRSGFYTTGDEQLSCRTEKKLQNTSQSQTAPKKGNGHCLMVCCWSDYSFLNTGETITSEKYAQQTNEMHGNLQHLWPGLVNRKGAIVLHDSGQSHAAQPVLQNWNQLS